MRQLTSLRVHSRTPQEEMKEKVGRILTPQDVDVQLRGPSKVYGPRGSLIALYLPAALTDLSAIHYPILTTIRMTTDNRNAASGASRWVQGRRTRSGTVVTSSLVGYYDDFRHVAGAGSPDQHVRICRTTMWTGKNAEEFAGLVPLFERVAEFFAEYVPDRYSTQMTWAEDTAPDLRIGNTPFTTITVNNTFPTGVHKDRGDLKQGFSCLAVFRRGHYTGGELCFPEYRFCVDMQDGDLLLMDAHEWHGNIALDLQSGDAERISLVLYYRKRVRDCAGLENADGA